MTKWSIHPVNPSSRRSARWILILLLLLIIICFRYCHLSNSSPLPAKQPCSAHGYSTIITPTISPRASDYLAAGLKGLIQLDEDSVRRFSQAMSQQSTGQSALQDLQDLTCLEYLYLFFDPRQNITSGFYNLTPLHQLTQLQVAWVAGQVKPVDLRPLAQLPRLRSLYITNSNLTDLSFLASANQLTELDLSYNPSLTNLSPLKNLTNLEALDLFNSINIKDFTSLYSLKKLRWLNLSLTSWTESMLEISTLRQALPQLTIYWHTSPLHETRLGYK